MDLIIVIYFIYTFFVLDLVLLKAIAIILIADWIYDVIGVVDNMINVEKSSATDENEEFTWKDRLYELYLWVHNIATIGFIAVTFFFKYMV